MSDAAAEVIHGEVMVVEPGTDIIEAVSAQPGIVLMDTVKFDQFYEKLAAKAPTDVDITTGSGRDKVRSFAAEVRREKAAIDKARLNLTAGWRDMTKQANEAGKVINERLEQLAADVRKPLTEWEEAEKAREAAVDRIITLFRTARFVAMGEAADHIRERGTTVHEIVIDREQFQDRTEEAEREKADTVSHLFAAVKAAEKAEADRAELEKLKAEAEERERLAAQQREADEAAARAEEEERIAEQARKDAAEAEKRRIEEAAEQAKRDAEQAAEREKEIAEAKRAYARSIIEHIKQVGIGMIGGQTYPYPILIHELEEKIVIDEHLGDLQDEVRAIRDLTLQNVNDAFARHMERAKTDEAEAARRAEEQAKAEELAAEALKREQRQADQAHLAKVMGAAKTAIMSCGVDEEAAKKVVLAIKAGLVPAVTIAF